MKFGKNSVTQLIFIIVASGQFWVQGVPVNKYHKFGEYGTIFIDTEYKYNWYEAWNECAVRNMTLIAVDTPEKSSILTDILKNNSIKRSLWLGGHDMGVEGQFIWSSTGKRFDFSNWSNGNPDNYNNIENCALIWDITNYEWNDGSCTGKLGFICEENRFLLAAQKDLEIKKRFIENLFSL